VIAVTAGSPCFGTLLSEKLIPDSLAVEPPVMPRVRRLPRRLDDGSLQPEDQQVKDVYRRLYFSSLDARITCLSSRFQNSAFELACNIKCVFIEVINTGNVPTTQNRTAHYGDDIDDSRLHLHLWMLGDFSRSAEPPVTLTATGIADVVQRFTDNVVWLQLLPEVVSLLRLFLSLPVTSNISYITVRQYTIYIVCQ